MDYPCVDCDNHWKLILKGEEDCQTDCEKYIEWQRTPP